MANEPAEPSVSTALPKVAIVGRPNVGKSSIFNWLLGQRVSIVDPTAGVTRDRVGRLLELPSGVVELVDTGGMGIIDAAGLTAEVEQQIRVAIDEADVMVFLVDAQTGLAPLDELVTGRLRGTGRPILCIANKCDTLKLRQQAEAEFSRLGLPLGFTSVHHNQGREELLSAIAEHIPKGVHPQSEPTLKIAVVGKRNVGKSTFINALAKMERMIVSEIPGTTRDSVDVRFEHHGRTFIAIDTAGVRRQRSLADSIEFYSFVRAQESVRRADMVLLFLDPNEPLSNVDKQLAQYVVDHYKPLVFVFNKWDTLVPRPTEPFSEYLDAQLPMMTWAPRVFITAKTGKNVAALVDLMQSLWKQANARVSTAELNRILQSALARKQPSPRNNRIPRIYYATQTGAAPPTIVLFVNDPKLLAPAYRRYLANAFRSRLPVAEIPIKLDFRQRGAAIDRSRAMPREIPLIDTSSRVADFNISFSNNPISETALPAEDSASTREYPGD